MPVFHSHSVPLFPHGVPPTGCSSWQLPPIRILPTGYSSQRTAPAWLLFNGVKSFRNCPWPPMGHRSCLKTFSYREFSLWATAPAWPLCRFQISSRHLPCLCHNVLHGHWWAQLWAVTSLELALCDMEQFWWLFTETTSVAHPPPKTFQQKDSTSCHSEII